MPSEATAIFAQRLKEARALRGVSQRALGARIGLSKETGSVRINRYEQQAARADVDTALKLAVALDVPLSYLYSETARMAELALVSMRLPPAEMDLLIETATRSRKE